MGQLIDGTWTSEPAAADTDGSFRRAPSTFRNWITADGAPGPSGTGGFAAESGRYHLYVSLACPWAHRTLIFRRLKGLVQHVGVDVVHPDLLDRGWSFATDFPGATGDSVNGKAWLQEVYLKADPRATTRVTVPVLWDKRSGRIVSNESAEIIRMFNSAFDHLTGNKEDFYPAALRPAIDSLNARIYETVNNGVYRAGFARSQRAYDAAVTALFDTLDWLEDRLSRQRYLAGDRVTEADWRLLTTLLRFDVVYHGHFKCARNRLVDFPSLWAYARELYQWPDVAATVDFDHIRRHYHYSHESLNPQRIVPIAPRIDWTAAHDRDRLAAA
ncbi:glutathione S-transferase family protein [Rhodobacteraceae bacterium 2CG4]|uniref:Glutathione S-transferase family protein n=1 Tax=Halovulum marinum TaxID=2662447 RepID=A0A6L5YX44_9RHOB|nr:glutathione S-transferase family protein [Halovulum marinum]MSU88224.1 glutathione S-transferase family protein [Halovulum marinum]